MTQAISVENAVTVTRKQLRGYGTTRYLARKLTESLEPLGKSGSAYVYDLAQAIAAIREYGGRSRIRPHTKQTLLKILDVLLPRLNNVVDLPTGNSSSEVSRLAQHAMQAMRQTDKALAEMKATAAALGEH
ncbi:MAG: hypothetical protein AAFP03_09360 [Cyanobacteria bacterium J06598_3]